MTSMTPLILSGLAWIGALVSPPQPLPPANLVPGMVWESPSARANRPSGFISELERSWQAERQIAASA